MKIFADNLGSILGCIGYPAGHLFHVEQAVLPLIQGKNMVPFPLDCVDHEAEIWSRLVARLGLELGEINASPV
jgi:hypothetical protein